jgi:biopolymer transport protein ExbD
MGLHRSKKGVDSKVQMPITPMLDMTFQLLFFFILNYHPSALEGQMELALPTQKPTLATNDVKPLQTADNPNEEDEPKEPPEVTVIVKAFQGVDSDKQGHISEITVRTKDTPSPTPISEENATEQRLLELLKDHLAKLRDGPGLGNKDDVLMQADRKLRWQFVVKVRDACQKAGFTNAHFSPPPD